ncbi:Aste57867_2182 [Aphanomyces stellatus]|uniref:glucan endo-1,3-beta-D-glucosidase n=1 Tax=Aphanomyces stellatus TaxID=120398 RepID=A0A485KBA3_9STRA|nr:hypothetical protein As57867_002177 [Aphanomyces stellatus]VFT79385.1 Aste57867_2182 [Aphanomyces stellatus]
MDVLTPNEDLEFASAPPKQAKSSRKWLGLVASLFVVGGTALGLVLFQSSTATTAALVGTGNDFAVCYDSYDDSHIDAHFKTIRQRFTGVRTYQTRGFRNAIDAAADAGLRIHAGVWIQTDDASVAADMQAVVDGVRRHPSTVQTVFVGNEELHNGWNQGAVLTRVRQMKQKLAAAGFGWVPVGSVQVDGDWAGATALAAECDVVGANIHPFFSASAVSTYDPIQDLNARWATLVRQFGSKAVVTETGWPTDGSQFQSHWPSFDLAEKFARQVADWVHGNGGTMPAYFMYHDNPTKLGDFEKHFGLATSNGQWKFVQAQPQPQPPPPPPSTDIKGVVFVQSDQVLAVTDDRNVEFHGRWGDDWVYDWASQWTIRGSLVVSWEASTQTDVCLDAYQPWDGGIVHVWPCDGGNANQKWKYDTKTHQLRHTGHSGFCLDMASEDNTPQLWTCHPVSSSWVASQQFEFWQK